MSNKNRTAGEGTEPTTGATEVAATPNVMPNYTLVYRREHPGARCSYGIQGVSGIVVFDEGLFADGKPPATIVLSCELAQPKPDNKALKAELAAQKAIEKAAKQKAKIEAAQAKAVERQAKADAALAAAKAKVEAAAAAAAAKASQ